VRHRSSAEPGLRGGDGGRFRLIGLHIQPRLARIEADPRLPSQRRKRRERRRPDPLAGEWESEIVPMLKAVPGIRAVAIFEGLCRRHPEMASEVRQTLERRIARWRALKSPQPG
jgi:hypothetical protein